jgi:hypothetical protein
MAALHRPSQPPIDPRSTGVRAKALPRFAHKPALQRREAERLREERLMASALDAAMLWTGMTNVRLGAILGVSESIVRGIRGTRQKPLQARHLFRLEKEAPEFFATLLHIAREVLSAPAVNDVDPLP